MCEQDPEIIILVAILLIFILLILFQLTVKVCLEDLTKLFPSFLQTIFDLFIQQLRVTRHPSQLNGRKVRHILCRTPPPPKLNLHLMAFGVINILWISTRSPSREQWYDGLNELEVSFRELYGMLVFFKGWETPLLFCSILNQH